MILTQYGFSDFFKDQYVTRLREIENQKKDLYEIYQPARVIADFGQKIKVMTEDGERTVARPQRSHIFDQQIATGDWIVAGFMNDFDEGTVKAVLSRMTKFSRAAAGKEVKEQIVATNVDTVFIIQSLNHDFNMRRLERYLVAAWDSGANPVIVLTKLDLCDDVMEKLMVVYEIAPGVDVIPVSSFTGEGIKELDRYIGIGKTIAVMGSSGVGKSTLINTLIGRPVLKTQNIREDDSKGRHTTTHRELVVMENGGILMDTPGMRTLSLWESDEGMEKMFGEIERLVKSCRFNDCTHHNEPGCAVQAAIFKGELDQRRWESWKKLQKELRFLDKKKDLKIKSLDRKNQKQPPRQKKVNIDEY
ncbi:MAG: ribosome small subunit-dependent GTPase A [Clostridiales bacterium 38-18]|nr:MAG: ribosome small subunit-dependent GTPase A [Clostridiales bacterium 38-18]